MQKLIVREIVSITGPQDLLPGPYYTPSILVDVDSGQWRCLWRDWISWRLELSVAAEPNQQRIGSNRLESARTDLRFRLYIIESNRTRIANSFGRIEPNPRYVDSVRIESNRS
jgi:hypothetical protein